MVRGAVAENLERIRTRIEETSLRCGRDPGEVTLVGVTKRIPLALVAEACAAGLTDLGENRIQDALPRQDELAALLAGSPIDPAPIRWHFIGHLQRNKAAKAAGRFALLHGVDSLELAERLSRHAAEASGAERILLEVNISGEGQKNGIVPGDAAALAERIAPLPGLELAGLMGMGRWGAAESELRASFASLRSLAEDLRRRTGLPLPVLSMGMSGDFESAILEGSTMVRIGTALFGPRQD